MFAALNVSYECPMSKTASLPLLALIWNAPDGAFAKIAKAPVPVVVHDHQPVMVVFTTWLMASDSWPGQLTQSILAGSRTRMSDGPAAVIWVPLHWATAR